MEKEEFIKLTASIFKEYGFKRKGSNFYLDIDEYLLVFGLQKSAFGPYYYINYGIIIKHLNPKMPFPKYYEANLRMGRVNFPSHENVDAAYYELIDEKPIRKAITEKILWLIPIVKSGKKSIADNFIKFGEMAIGMPTVNYLEIPPDAKHVLPETLWDE